MKGLILVLGLVFLFSSFSFAEKNVSYEVIDSETVNKITTIPPIEQKVIVTICKKQDLLQEKINLLNENERINKEKFDKNLDVVSKLAVNDARIIEIDDILTQMTTLIK